METIDAAQALCGGERASARKGQGLAPARTVRPGGPPLRSGSRQEIDVTATGFA